MRFVNPIIENIWKDRYCKNGESLEDNFHRVAKYCSKTVDEENEFYNVMKNGLFFPAGRTMSNSGIGNKLTLNNCFIANTKVITKRGLINIEDVVVGDYVITEDGSWQKVVNTLERDYSGDLYVLKGKSFYNDIVCTPNHNFLTQNGWKRADRLMIGENVHAEDRLKMPNVWFEKTYEDVDLINIIKNTDDLRIVEDNGKIHIEKLCQRNKHNDNINWMKVNNPINRYIKFTPDFRYFIGRWLGDGSITRYKGKKNHQIIQIVFNATKEKDAAERCMKIGEEIFGLKAEYRQTNQNIIAVRWSNEILGEWFFREFGEKCDGKYIKDKYLGDFEIVKGLLDSDGTISTHGAGSITLKNYQIIEWIRDTLFLNGCNTFKITADKKYEHTFKVAYSVSVGNGRLNKHLTKTYFDGRKGISNRKEIYTDYTQIESIEILENQNCKVYNLSVENVNSYTANGVIVHNCFTAPQIGDSYDEIFDTVKLGAITHQRGGGIGYDFSQLRPKGSPTSNNAVASGPVSFMDVFNAQTETTIQGQRRGANMGIMSVYHMDIETFINAKATDKNKLNHFNLSVMVDDDFIDAVKNNKTIFLHHPVYDENGRLLKDKTKWIYSKEVSALDIWNMIMRKAYDTGEPGIFFYDNLNKDNTIWYIEQIVCTNPCSEYLAGTIYGNNPNTGEKLNSKDFGGACNLGSLFLHNFVIKPFTKEATIDWELLRKTIYTAVKFLDNIIDINKFPSPIYENYQRSFRTIGMGYTGLADALVMLNLKYNTKEARDYVDNLTEFIAFNAYKASIELAKERGAFSFLDREKYVQSGYIMKHCKELDSSWREIKEDILKYGIRNAKILSIAPVGTLSLTFGNNCSSGLEPIFSLEYERRVKIGGQTDENETIVAMRDYAYGEWIKIKDDPSTVVTKDVFITALEMNVNDHIDMLGTIAKHIDMSCSKTINVPEDYSFEDTKDIYMRCHDLGIKGCTIFRPNALRQGVMITKKDNEVDLTTNTDDDDGIEIKKLERGMIIKVDNNTIGKERHLVTGCGTLHLSAFFDPDTGDLLESYLSKGSSGGCLCNLTAISRMISLSARAGVDVYTIADQLKSVPACPSYAVRAATRHDTSRGNSCPVAVANALIEMYKEIQDDLFDEDEEFQPTPNKVVKAHSDNNVITVQKEKNVAKCPECGGELVFEGGCNTCRDCGYSHCG